MNYHLERAELKFMLKVICTIVLGVALFFGFFGGVALYSEKKYCDRMERLAPDYQFDFDLFGGCLVQLDGGRWIPVNSVEYVEGQLKLVP